MRIVYTGPLAAVEIPGARIVNVRPGAPVDVPEDIGKTLVGSRDWEEAPPPFADADVTGEEYDN